MFLCTHHIPTKLAYSGCSSRILGPNQTTLVHTTTAHFSRNSYCLRYPFLFELIRLASYLPTVHVIVLLVRHFHLQNSSLKLLTTPMCRLHNRSFNDLKHGKMYLDPRNHRRLLRYCNIHNHSSPQNPSTNRLVSLLSYFKSLASSS